MMRSAVPHVGATLPRQDAYTKVRGEEPYPSDFYAPDMLFAGVKRAGIPHGHIKAIHDLEARALKGVVAVLTAKDITGSNRQGVIRKDQPVLADDKVRHCGDGVALVIAEDLNVLRKAIDSIQVEVDPLPGIFDPDDALKEDAPVIHEDNPTGNILLKGSLERGNVPKAFEECAHIVEGVFTVPMQEHAYLETEAGWAVLRDDDRVHITVATQTPFRDRTEVAGALGLDPDRIRILAPFCGGAFGGKDGISVQSLLGLAALTCPGRPVKMWWSREESFLASPKRHPARIEYRLGALSDGRLHAIEARITFDTGPYDHLGGAVMALGLEHAGGPYRIPNTSLKAFAVYTNNPIGGAFRAFGVAQVNAALEQMMDMLASKAMRSPLELRERSGVQKGDMNAIGVTLTHGTGFLDCLERLKAHPLWRDREAWKSGAGRFKKRGTGVASVFHGMGYGRVVPDVANAKVELTDSGSFRLFCGVVDMGQGNAATYLQIACDLLNQGLDRMELVLPDTDRTLPSGSSSASRTTYTFGNALIGSCKRLKDHLLSRASDLLLGRGGHEMALVPGRIRHLPSGREITLEDFARILPSQERSFIHRFRMPVAPDNVTTDEPLMLHGIPHAVFSYGVHLACVEVDELTGRVKIEHYLAVSDCGRIINPQAFEQQIQGGIAQSVGYALSEDFKAADGVIQTQDLSTYIIPTALDMPDIESLAVEIPEASGPFGLKGAGEIATDGPLPAVSNAVFDACGVRVFHAPLTPERVLDALCTSTEGGIS